ncbi:GTPase IMAP member 4 [Datura stramonium]|uniref:GTPase IMAP member 4 n=1 Tax=Datura stramonium TaxID=4076 RepID=A0ABS8UJ20_DATST|nr:GTPase IMAP member 4 [Datura stramonium]
MGGSAILSDGWELDVLEMEKVQQAIAYLEERRLGRCLNLLVLHRPVRSQRAQLPKGQILDVIDTPDCGKSQAGPEIVRNEIARCFDLAKDGIHAVLLVLSVRDDLEDLDVSLDDYLGSNFPDPLEDHDQKAKLDSSSGYSEQEMKELKDQMQRSHEEQIRRIGEMVESKECAARLAAEQKVKKAQKKS